MAFDPITIVASPAASHQIQHQNALIEGFRALGVPTIESYGGKPRTKHVACWGWRQGARWRAQGHEVLVIERGYLGDRFNWTSLAWNGLNGRGKFKLPPDDGGERFRQHFVMSPWRDGGDYILLLGQVPGDASLQGRDMRPWYATVTAQAAKIYRKPVHFRPHPVAISKGHGAIPPGCIKSTGSLEEALSGAYVAIAFNSNSAVDSVMAGTPALTFDEGAMAWDVTGHAIGQRVTPDRERWAAELAWKQWTLDEIRSGFALQGLMELAP